MTANRSLRLSAYHARTVVSIAALLAAARVVIFAAAFPFFNSIDEQQHFDLVNKYSHGLLPRPGTDHFEAESGRIIATFGTWEYLTRAESLRTIPVPTWSLPREIRDWAVPASVKRWEARINHEAFSPPMYYAVTGIWYRLLRLVGFGEGGALYGLRFLNAVWAAALVVLGYAFARRHFPSRPGVYLGVPLLL